jgi:hypothetical protein
VKIGFYTCGLARTALAGKLRELGEDLFLGWGSAIFDNYNNKSVLGFILEQMCLSSISQRGLHAAGLDFGMMKTIVFPGNCPDFDVKSPLTLYVPVSYNFPAIDGAVLSLNHQEKLAQLVPLQVTIAARHTDSEQRFFSTWKPWSDGLMEEGYGVEVKFLWITGARRSATEVVAETVRNTRRGPAIVNPRYERSYVTIEDLDKDIGEKLGRAEKKYEGTN